MRVEDIVVGKRFRKEIGDIEGLKKSIKETTMLEPIVVKPSGNDDGKYTLIAGMRRLTAVKELGHEDLPEDFVRVVDTAEVLRGEYDENFFRKDMTVSERVELAKEMKLEAARLFEQKRADAGRFGALGKTGKATNEADGEETVVVEAGDNEEHPAGDKIELMDYTDDGEAVGSRNVVDLDTRRAARESGSPETKRRDYSQLSRQEIAKKVGLAHSTLAKAETVVQAAEADPERFGEIKEEMDRTGKVEPAFQKVKDARKKYEASEALYKLGLNPILEVPGFVYSALQHLPPDVQVNLINEYEPYIYSVKQADFDRAVKNHSKGQGVVAMDETVLQAALADIFRYTKKRNTEWVLMPMVRSVLNAMKQVVEVKGDVTNMDRMEFAMIGFSGFLTFFTGYAHQNKEAGIIPDMPADLLPEFNYMLERFQSMFEKRAFTMGGVKRREEIGEARDLPDERRSANAMVANANIDTRAGDMNYFKKMFEGIFKSIVEERAAS